MYLHFCYINDEILFGFFTWLPGKSNYLSQILTSDGGFTSCWLLCICFPNQQTQKMKIKLWLLLTPLNTISIFSCCIIVQSIKTPNPSVRTCFPEQWWIENINTSCCNDICNKSCSLHSPLQLLPFFNLNTWSVESMVNLHSPKNTQYPLLLLHRIRHPAGIM